MNIQSFSIAAVFGVLGYTATAEEISVVSWNVENWGGSDAGEIGRQLRDDYDGIDIFGLSEISDPGDFDLYAEFASKDEGFTYMYVPGTTGANVKLGILFNSDKYTLNDSYEMFDMMGTPAPDKPRTGRAPLVANLTSNETGLQFLVVVNHFHRGDERRRLEQAQLLAAWGASQSLPVVAVGDYNFDYDLDTLQGNVAYEAFLQSAAFEWIQPSNMITTNWSDRNEDGENDYNSILDFVFLAQADWAAYSNIIVKDGDFPDDEYTSDHRPVLAVFSTETGIDLAAMANAADRTDMERDAPQKFAAVAAPRASMVNVPSNIAVQARQIPMLQSSQTNAFNALQFNGAQDAALSELILKVERLREEVQQLKDQASQ